MSAPSSLHRFVQAQEGVYPRALAELRAGHKTGHWMWFVFPQLTGLGSSPTAQYYALADLAQARAYLGHEVLGERLRECVRTVGEVTGRTAEQIFGPVDAMKLRSCLTLFDRAAAPDDTTFRDVLVAYFDGPDQRTLDLLG